MRTLPAALAAFLSLGSPLMALGTAEGTLQPDAVTQPLSMVHPEAEGPAPRPGTLQHNWDIVPGIGLRFAGETPEPLPGG